MNYLSEVCIIKKQYIMNSNYIPNKSNNRNEVISALEDKKQKSIAYSEKKSAIYAAFLFLLVMASITIYFMGESIFMNYISISLFIISCILLIRMSGPTLQK